MINKKIEKINTFHLKTQNSLLWEVKDALQNKMTNAQMHKILITNDQEIIKGDDRTEVKSPNYL